MAYKQWSVASSIGRICFIVVALLGTACSSVELSKPASETQERVVTLLFTNDLESAYDPIAAYWRDDIEFIGGVAQLATLIENIRATEPNVFLFDAGDIFTGTLSKLTLGELPLELMISMHYDAMTIGNHEFEYGWETFATQKNRVPFPVLGANIFYKDTDHPYAQPYAIVERNGIRIGVIGIFGQDAATALIPSHIAGLEVREPAPIVAGYVAQLRDSVDLIVLLTHQGKTAPMQTDDEGRPDVKRDIDVDIALAGSVPGIDVLLGGHADAGTETPVVQPDTGTLIMQTYGQGQHLGYLQLTLGENDAGITASEGRLIVVESDKLPAEPTVAQKLQKYRSKHADIYKVIGRTTERLSREYNRESDLGNLFADILREHASADIGLMQSGALRRDIPEGDVSLINVLDAFPFTDFIAVAELSGRVLRKVLEQGLTLERGILQVSGLTVTYDPTKAPGERILEVFVGEERLVPDGTYRIATLDILAQGGDSYRQFLEADSVQFLDDDFADVLTAYFETSSPIRRPTRGRLVPISE